MLELRTLVVRASKRAQGWEGCLPRRTERSGKEICAADTGNDEALRSVPAFAFRRRRKMEVRTVQAVRCAGDRRALQLVTESWRVSDTIDVSIYARWNGTRTRSPSKHSPKPEMKAKTMKLESISKTVAGSWPRGRTEDSIQNAESGPAGGTRQMCVLLWSRRQKGLR